MCTENIETFEIPSKISEEFNEESNNDVDIETDLNEIEIAVGMNADQTNISEDGNSTFTAVIDENGREIVIPNAQRTMTNH